MILYGAGGHAKVVIDCITDTEEEVVGIFDDKSEFVSINGFDVLGPYSAEIEPEEKLVITLGDNRTRSLLAKKVNHPFGKVIHESAIVSKYAQVDEGSVVLHGSILQAGVKIGKHCIINTAANINQDVRIESFTNISPNVTLCDNVTIQEGVHIGAGAIVLPKVTVGKHCVIGAGSVITQNLPDYSLVVGVPGKIVRKLN